METILGNGCHILDDSSSHLIYGSNNHNFKAANQLHQNNQKRPKFRIWGSWLGRRVDRDSSSQATL